MPRETKTFPLSAQPSPQLGDIVLFRPVLDPTRNASVWPAIVQYIVDESAGVFDLCVFTDKGPVVKKDVQRWSGGRSEGWTPRN